jgi:SAM-dependent methyltransferase
MTVKKVSKWEQIQKTHLDKIAFRYELHYSDECSQKYRAKFVNKPMTENINLSHLHILEAMCGSGQTTQFLLRRGAKVTGLDISSKLIDSFRKKYPECNAICASILDSKIEDCSFDGVVVVGGLHHLHPKVNQAIDEIYRILKPGGYFLFAEPHTESWPNLFRRLWYKFDSQYFEKNEDAIDIACLKFKNSFRFEFIKTKYLGNIAYLPVLHTLILRIPLWIKRFYTPVVIGLESIFTIFQSKIESKRLSFFVVCQWKKKYPSAQMV